MLSTNLNNFWKAIIKDRLLLLILLIGLVLRSSNPTFGSPSLFVSNDEAIAHLSALNMLASKTVFSISNYTPFGAYVQIPFIILAFALMVFTGNINNISDFELLLLTNEGYLLFIPRLISALFGTLLIIVSYKLTLALFNKKAAALIAASLTAVSFNLVHISNSGRPWSASLFFMLLAVYLMLKRKQGLSLISMVAGFGFHQVSILILPLLLMLQRPFPKMFFLKSALALGAVFLISSLSGSADIVSGIKNSQSFLLPGKFLPDLIIGNQNLFESARRTINENLSLYYISNLFFTDTFILLFGAFGMLITFKKSFQTKALITYILCFFVFASLFFHPLIRYLLPILIILIPFSAMGIYYLLKKKSFLLIVLAVTSVNSIYWNILYLKTPTFILAKQWIDINVPRNDTIIYTGGRFNTFVPDKNSISHMQKIDSKYWSRLSSKTDYKGSNVRSVIFSNKFPGKTKYEQIQNATQGQKYQYVVDYHHDSKDSLLSEAPEKFVIVAQFSPKKNGGSQDIAELLFDASSNFDSFEKRHNDSMYQLKKAGPYFDILKSKEY